MSTFFAFLAMLIPTLLVMVLAAVTVAADDVHAPVDEMRYHTPY